MKNVDAIIVGQGLAGTTLAWTLLEAGLDFVVLDGKSRTSASEVAAGLMTPITGRCFAFHPEWDDNWRIASRFYRSIEKRINTPRFFHHVPMTRLFRSDSEALEFHSKAESRLRGAVSCEPATDDPRLIRDFHGGFQMPGGQLNVPEYLSRSRDWFQQSNRFLPVNVELNTPLTIREGRVQLCELDLSARWIVYCTGFVPSPAEFLSPIQFNPARGEILDLEPAEISLSQVIHRGIWIAPQPLDAIRVGATYEWNDLSDVPTPEGRQWLLNRLAEFFAPETKVIGQQAAIRPTMHDFHPVVGIHPHLPNVGVLNGLGSKGSLTAPRLAQALVGQMLNQTPIPEKDSLSRWYN
ncbi:bifunctional tRNA (mnm(5)s(2)U34)-methyltransferase/FAD-dependent cmnm(5)s(2)U34 oxidoreductase [Thalassoglobus neptunius]|uniref:Bifunctional tRNA (Mnm(5)s(2)U34)-methyltransferase/FAD-dependent cmnm(5)s(2)U34 oxidoreductase n=1 Tax=Thalassoglobus neptunius TaxID=1938619 RepID=A0A5C5WYN8_9PLAN|nr:FAD-dependent oxidoreductase [Thalassoglobus neptunius]TWT55806.1 bifunctional tRNA (mnm(5)s(2)U34)-methyltransferase/FAD-dependent cmnm(5)s(2)U34 oxidoreductase [Thalassoglobus neptunius]